MGHFVAASHVLNHLGPSRALKQGGVRSLRVVRVRHVDGARGLVAPILLAAGDRLRGLAADKVDDVVWDERTIARARHGIGTVGLARRLPCCATKEFGTRRGEDGEVVSDDALEWPVHRDALAASS